MAREYTIIYRGRSSTFFVLYSKTKKQENAMDHPVDFRNPSISIAEQVYMYVQVVATIQLPKRTISLFRCYMAAAHLLLRRSVVEVVCQSFFLGRTQKLISTNPVVLCINTYTILFNMCERVSSISRRFTTIIYVYHHFIIIKVYDG